MMADEAAAYEDALDGTLLDVLTPDIDILMTPAIRLELCIGMFELCIGITELCIGIIELCIGIIELCISGSELCTMGRELDPGMLGDPELITGGLTGKVDDMTTGG